MIELSENTYAIMMWLFVSLGFIFGMIVGAFIVFQSIKYNP